MKYKVQDFFILSEKYAAIDTRLWDTDCRLENMSTCWEGEKIKRPGKLHTPLSPRPCQSFSFVWLALSYVLCNNLAIWIQTSTGKTYFFLEEITEVLQVFVLLKTKHLINQLTRSKMHKQKAQLLTVFKDRSWEL